MSRIEIQHDLCTACQVCVQKCPFMAMEFVDGKVLINSACRMCSICVRVCPQHIISKVEEVYSKQDIAEFRDILVITETKEQNLHPISLELIGEARKLADKCGQSVAAMLYGYKIEQHVPACINAGADTVYLLDHPDLVVFRSDRMTILLAHYLKELKPNIVLVGATLQGRSLAPRLASSLNTGLTADCTQLDITVEAQLIQTRPAYGGNIMADILTKYHRPQMASVRYKVFATPITDESRQGKTIRLNYLDIPSAIEITKIEAHLQKEQITDAKRLVVAGLGMSDTKGLALIHELAHQLDATVAYTRPMVERGIAKYTHQIGLSGRSVKAELVITCGVSGAIQFVSGMSGCDQIIAINKDPKAEIFEIADVAVVGDGYEILVHWIQELKQGDYHV